MYKVEIMDDFQFHTECVLVCFCMFIPCVELNGYGLTLKDMLILQKFEG